MPEYFDIFRAEFLGYAGYLWREITSPDLHSYFYLLILISLAVLALELRFPWRADQPRIRRDFGLDAFYMFFNFFLFSLIGYAAISKVAVTGFRDLLAGIGIENTVALEVQAWPVWAQLLTLLVTRDFVQWNVHRLLHRVPFLWEFHKVHHSVVQMGFAAHLRFHWMETVVYRTLEYLPLAMIGFGIEEFFAVHLFTLTIGHLNHANLSLPIGPLRYVFNSPQMHIWHHMKQFPERLRYGVDYGLTLSVWDWLFGTVWWPGSGRDIELGFDDVERFPPTFLAQVTHPWHRRRAAPFDGGAA